MKRWKKCWDDVDRWGSDREEECEMRRMKMIWRWWCFGRAEDEDDRMGNEDEMKKVKQKNGRCGTVLYWCCWLCFLLYCTGTGEHGENEDRWRDDVDCWGIDTMTTGKPVFCMHSQAGRSTRITHYSLGEVLQCSSLALDNVMQLSYVISDTHFNIL